MKGRARTYHSLAIICTLICCMIAPRITYSQADDIRGEISNRYDYLEQLYRHFHEHPELSLKEDETSDRLATELRELGFDVTENVGGHGVVALLRNGSGPTVMVRTDLDALPIKEETGVPFRSTATGVDRHGDTVPVMHACGHDMHMSVLVGTAAVMQELRDEWQGTLMLIGQPAEELLSGAEAMIEDGLFERFPRPDFALALHVNSAMASGTVGYAPGYAYANVDEGKITVKGRGGHGAYPDLTVDPVVIASKLILDLQTVVSREISALNPAVITVGSIHGGTSGNIIPNEVVLEITMRSFSSATRDRMMESIERRLEGAGRSAGLERENWPTLELGKHLPSMYNDPELAERMSGVFAEVLGAENVSEHPPVLYGEDFAQYGRVENAPKILMYSLGSQKPADVRAAAEGQIDLPSTHNSRYLPDTEPTLRTGVLTMSSALMNLFSSHP